MRIAKLIKGTKPTHNIWGIVGGSYYFVNHKNRWGSKEPCLNSAQAKLEHALKREQNLKEQSNNIGEK